MTLTARFSARRLVGLAALAFQLFGTLGASAAAGAPVGLDAPAVAEGVAPNLSAALTTGADPLVSGDDITYSAELVNRGESLAVRVVLSPPTYIEAEEVDGGVLEAGGVTWSATLAPGATRTFEVGAHVTEIPVGEQRATALLSVYVGDSTTPLVRTASADRIAGVDDAQVVEGEFPTSVLWGGIVAVLLLSVVAAVLVVVLRRRKTVAEAAAADIAPGYRRTEQVSSESD